MARRTATNRVTPRFSDPPARIRPLTPNTPVRLDGELLVFVLVLADCEGLCVHWDSVGCLSKSFLARHIEGTVVT